MKTIIARFTELKENVSEADSEFDDLDYNKVDKALKSVGISLKDAQGQFRDLDDVFLELSSKWDTLDRNTQRYIATIAAGSRQQSRFIAMMEDYDRTMELVETAQDSAGRSSEQFAKYQDTVEYKMNQLKNSWEQFRTSLIDSDVFKDAIDGLTGIVNKLNKMDVKKLASFVAAFLLVGKSAIISLAKGISQSTNLVQKAVSDTITKATTNVKGKIGKALGGKLSFDINFYEKGLDQITADLEITKNLIKQSTSELESMTYMSAGIGDSFEGGMVSAMELYNIYSEIIPVEERGEITFRQWLDSGANLRGVSEQTKNEINQIARELVGAQVAQEKLTEKGEQYTQSLNKATSTLEARSKTYGQAAGNAFGLAFTSAISVCMMENDPMEAFKKTVLTSLATTIPMVVSQVTAAIGTMEATAIAAEAAVTLGISLLITAVVAGAALGYKALKKAFEPTSEMLTRQAEEANEAYEAQKKVSSEAKNTYSEHAETLKGMKNLKEEYEELQRKSIKTTEEQERYNELVEQIRTEMPSVVEYYNEVTGELKVQNELWDSIIEKENILIEKASQEKFLTSLLEVDAATEKSRADLKLDEYKELANGEDVENGWLAAPRLTNGQSQDALRVAVENAKNNLATPDEILEELSMVYFGFSNQDYWDKIAEKVNSNLLDNNGHLKSDEAKKELIEIVKFLNETEVVPENLGEKEKEYWAQAKNYMQEYSALSEDFEGRKNDINASQTQGKIDAAITRLQEKGYNANTSNILAKAYYGETNENRDALIKQGLGVDLDEIANKSYSDLVSIKYMQDTLIGLGITSETEFNTWVKDTENWSEKLYDSYITVAEGIELGSIELTNAQQAYLDQLSAGFSDMTKEEQDKALIKIQRIFGEDNIITKYYKKQAEDFSESLQAQKEQISRALNINLDETWSKNAVTSLVERYGQISEQIGEVSANNYFKAFNEKISDYNLSPEQMNNVLNFNWSNINTLNYKEYKDKFLEMCEELGIEGGQRLFEEVYSVNTLYGLTNLLDLTEEQIEESAKEIKEKVDSIWSAEGDFVTVITGARTGTALDVDTYLKIKEELENMGLNAENYISIMEDGSIIVDDADGLQQIYENQLSVEYRQLEANKQKIKDAIKLLEIQKATLETQLADPSIGGQDKSRIYKKALIDTNARLQEYNNYISEIEKSQEQAQEDFRLKNKKFHDDLAAKRDEAEEESKKAIEDTTKAVEDAQKKVQDALEKIAKAEQDVIDKTNELNEALYGDPLHNNKLDPLYNYNTQLEQFTKNATRAKEALSKMQPGDDARSLINDFLTNTHGELVNRRSQNEVIAASIANYQADLTSRLSAELASMNARYGASMSTNTSDYIYQSGNRVGINFQALNAAQLPDSISDYVEETVETINKLQDQIDDNVDEIKKKEQELRDMRKDALERRKSLEDEVVKTLQEKAKEEIDTQKDKYDALKDADNDYLDALEDAIKRERDLRNKANEWDSLATKEKKLSLIQRDTSGANEKEVMKLENEVQNDREKLLDESVDDIINGMKEMYELQQESREIEIEYQEAMLENADTIKAATAIIEGWHTSDDLVAWFVENATKEFTEGSETTKEIMITEWQETGEQMVADTELLQTDIMSAAEVTQEQITTNIYNTSEILTSQSQLTLDTVLASTNDAIQKGQQALADAIASVQAARDEYTEAIAALREAEDAARQAQVDALALKGELEEQADKDALKIEWQHRYDTTSNQPARDEIARRAISELGNEYYWENNVIRRRYASGGLVDYTGPAWVDGTPSQPEAFLSAEDTQRIGEAAQLLADLPIFGGSSFNSTSITNGDSLIEVHINIENIASDVDLDNALDKMKSAIWEAANPAGSSVILSK